MKLLYIYDQLPQTYQAYMLNLLSDLERKIDVKVLTYKGDKRSDYSINSYGLIDKIQRLVFKINISKSPSRDIKIMNNYDIIHIQHSYLYPKLTPFFNNKVNKPKIVITLRGGDTYIKPWVSDKLKEFYKVNSKYIDAFITVSEHQKKYLQKWGVSANKIHVIPVSFGSKTNAKPKEPSKNKIRIVSAHRMCWEKNIEGNLRVIKLLKEKGYPVRYDIFGDGSDKGQVYYLIDKYGLQEEVSFLGKINNEEFKNKLPAYDFFLQLSHSEAFGAAVIEAQSLGVPAIISNSGGLPETIIENKSGFCVNSDDISKAVTHIIELFSAPALYYYFSEEAIKNSNKWYTTKIEVEKLIKLYKELFLE